eukprot:gb/GEZJ01003961.1/.p1 GENE.gb/GEZJ01003961.1/~~gb/GEZJ01003961.1/.p1  ORF type:complete len:532 (-),score=61.41 gb/GEZJ01003961.1/:403-1998(-)
MSGKIYLDLMAVKLTLGNGEFCVVCALKKFANVFVVRCFVGVKTASGELLLNPQDSYVIDDGDEIIVLAEDDDTYCASITHPLIREKVPDRSSRSGYRHVEICAGGLDAIRNFSNTWASNPSLSLSRLESRDIAGCEVDRVLYCGWRFDMGNLLQVFSAVAPLGSEFWILSEMPIEQRDSELRLRGWENSASKVKVIHHVGACRRNVLAQLPLESFTSVIVGGSDASSISKVRSNTKVSSEANSIGKSGVGDGADARVITVVMMIQDIITRRNSDGKYTETASSRFNLQVGKNFDDPRSLKQATLTRAGKGVSLGLARAKSQKFLGSRNTVDVPGPMGVIVGEIVDSRSRAMLSMVNSIDAVVASSELISKAVAMVSEDRSVNRVLNTLFDPYDSEITLEGVETYVDISSNERVSFFELMARGRDVGTIVMGYLDREIVQAENENQSMVRYTDVILNPPHKDIRKSWHHDDLLIVLTPGTDDTSSLAPSEFFTDVTDLRPLEDNHVDVSWHDPPPRCDRRVTRVRFETNEH